MRVSSEKPSKIVHELANDIRGLLAESDALKDPAKRATAKKEIDALAEILALRELGA